MNTKEQHNIPIKVYKVLERMGVDLSQYKHPITEDTSHLLTCIDFFSR